MTEQPRDNTHAGDLAQMRRIHGFCEDFEARFRARLRPCIEETVATADPDDRGVLLAELIALEVELRRETGEGPAASEYLARFPDAGSRVEMAFAQAALPLPAVVARGARRDATDEATVDLGRASTAVSPGLAGCERVSLPDTVALDRVGEYEIVEELARGGMGVVYRARHRGLKRSVALKMILTGQMATADERERFRREAELAANLDHPNIVPIFEVSEFQGCPFFSMKLVEGGSLAREIKAKRKQHCPHDPNAAAFLLATLARAVHYAHERGFLHCDLKPSNILIDGEGRPHITDFGLAKRTSEDSSLSTSGAILGTPSYMAPEQASGSRRNLSPATDVYGLGAIFYEVLSGRPPLEAETIMETVVAVLERDPIPPRELRPGIPKELETICLKCLEKSPQDRYASADELADELNRYLQGEVIGATTLIPRLKRWNRREPELVARLGGLLLVALLAQFNYLVISETPNFWYHYTIQGVLALWAASAVVFQAMMRAGWRADLVRLLWSAADITLLTIEMKLFEKDGAPTALGLPVVNVETTLLVGYPLLIAASGLWWRTSLVWITTALAICAYIWLYVDAALGWRNGWISWSPSPDLQHPNIFLAALLVTGYVVARQVRRILLLSQYYEHRPPA
jgi:eukaryotic-like serine/threonine-protein kinase